MFLAAVVKQYIGKGREQIAAYIRYKHDKMNFVSGASGVVDFEGEE